MQDCPNGASVIEQELEPAPPEVQVPCAQETPSPPSQSKHSSSTEIKDVRNWVFCEFE